MSNLFLMQFEKNIKFTYTCFDRIIIRGYIRKLFFEAGLILYLRAMGFNKIYDEILCIFTDQLNSHIKKRQIDAVIPFTGSLLSMGIFITDTKATMIFSTKELRAKRGKTF